VFTARKCQGNVLPACTADSVDCGTEASGRTAVFDRTVVLGTEQAVAWYNAVLAGLYSGKRPSASLVLCTVWESVAR
jgi:hypothetical protein